MASSPFTQEPTMPGFRQSHSPDWVEAIRANAWRNRPGFGGVVQLRTQAGYHALDAAPIEGTPIADYKLVRQISTQSGTRPAVVNLYRVEYMSQ